MSNQNLTLALKIKADLQNAINELDRMGFAMDGTRQSADKLNRTNQVTSNGFNAIAASVKAATLTVAAGFGLNEIIQSADAWTAYQNRLRLVTDTQFELQQASQDVYEIARLTSQQLDSTASVYQRFAQNAERLNITQEQSAELTETVSKAIAISGGSAASAEAALVQFGQALASGVLRGEEFNSVSEQAPALLMAIADGIDVDIGKLREMAKEGELTADVLVEALERSRESVDSQFSTRVKTVAQGATELNTAFTRLIGTMSTSNGMSATLSGSLTSIANVVDNLADNTEVLGAVIDAALVLTAGRALIAITGLSAAKVKAILTTRAEAAAELAAAKAHAASTASKLASARATGSATAASIAHTAALQRLAAAQAATTVTGAGVLGILGGPVGMIAMTAIAASGLYAFRDSSDDVRTSLFNLEEPLDTAIERLQKLSDIGQQQAMLGLQRDILTTTEELQDLADTAETATDKLLKGYSNSGLLGGPLVPLTAEAKQVLDELRQASIDVANGVEVDFGRIYNAIRDTSGITEETRSEMLNLLADLDKKGGTLQGQKKLYDALAAALTGTAAAAEDANNALKNSPQADKAAKEYLEALQKQFQQLQNLSPVEQARAFLVKNQIKEQSDLAKQILKQAEANQKLNDSNRTSDEQARQAESRLRSQKQFVDQLERTANTYGKTAAETRAYQISEKDLSGTLLERARAASAAITTQEKLNQAIKDANTLEDIQIQLLRSNGQGVEARGKELQEQFRDLLKRLKDPENGDADGAALIERFIDVELARTKLDEVQAEINAALSNQNLAEQTIQTELDAGLIDELDARQRLIGIHRETADILERQRPLLEELSQQPGAVGEAAGAAYKQLNNQVRELRSTSSLLESSLKNGLSGGIQTAIKGLADGTLTLREAVSSLVSSVASAITELLAKLIAQRAVLALFGGSTGGGLFGFSEGGFTGPGTKYDVAGVVHAGEYVQPMARMQEPGALQFMEAFRAQGMQVLNHFRGYADGGSVGAAPTLQPALAAGSGTQEVNIFNSLDPDETASKVLSTRTASRSIVNVIRAEKRQIKALLEG